MRYDNPIVDFWFEEAAKPAETTAADREVRGVILDVNVEGGVDVLAAFASGRARFLNRTGDISMWEGGEGPRATFTAELLERVIPITRNPPQPPGESSSSSLADECIRFSVFTGFGMHVAQGPIDEYDRDPVFHAAVALMDALEGIEWNGVASSNPR